MDMIKICGLTTQACTINAFMLKNLNHAAKNGFDCYAISQPDYLCLFTKESLGEVKHIPLNIKWGYMTPHELISVVYRLYRIFKKEQFDIIQYATMNAALCASIAGWLARIPVRINLMWGLDFVMFKGWKRWLYYCSTKLICMLSTNIQPDSFGNLQFGLSNGLIREGRGEVIFNGSACGLDISRFDYRKRSEWRDEIRKSHNLSKYKVVFGFVGQLYYDKGINELFEAFLNINAPDCALVMVGGIDKMDTLNQEILEKAKQNDNVFILGRKSNPEHYYASFDFLILPSYSEGFGMCVLEAAGVGTPSIVSNIKGPTDFVKDGVNGLICEPHSVMSLQSAMKKAINMSNDEYNRLAQNALNVARNNYNSEIFKKKFVENRKKLYEESKRK